MMWTLRFSPNFDKQFTKLEKNQKTRIISYLKNRLTILQDPKTLGKPLMGNLKGYWRFRVGEFRIITDIQDETLTIVALEVGHRREIYK